MKITSALVTICLSAFGMFVGDALWHYLPAAKAYADSIQNSVIANQFTIVDNKGNRRIQMGIGEEGSPAIWFFDQNGKARLNIGLYGDGNSFVVMNDEHDKAVQIFRTYGDSAPVLVMKSEGTDRIILGLKDGTKEPVFVTFDEKGNKNTIFGNW